MDKTRNERRSRIRKASDTVKENCRGTVTPREAWYLAMKTEESTLGTDTMEESREDPGTREEETEEELDGRGEE